MKYYKIEVYIENVDKTHGEFRIDNYLLSSKQEIKIEEKKDYFDSVVALFKSPARIGLPPYYLNEITEETFNELRDNGVPMFT